MSDPTGREERPITATPAEFLVTFGVIIGLIMFFLAFDGFLARIDREEATSRAAGAYEEGKRLAAAGELDEASDRFRAATWMSRENTMYSLALAQSLLAQEKNPEAKRILDRVLQRDPTNGRANVLIARDLLADGRVEEAKAHYHRAVYGRWPEGENGSGLEARFELIELLARTDARKELLAELLVIQEQSFDNLDRRKNVGRLFLVAGSPERAAEVFSQVIQHRPRDAQAIGGLGEAALALGNYSRAEENLARAARLAPGDSTVADRLELARARRGLDPLVRGLRLSERYERSHRVLLATEQLLSRCALDSASAREVATADSLLRLPARRDAAGIDDAAEIHLSVAQRLWAIRPSGCTPGVRPEDRALVLLQDRLAR
ncbi:MAG: tetratricopeptide repeat protein [Gemmatimonadaceae bacterium]